MNNLEIEVFAAARAVADSSEWLGDNGRLRAAFDALDKADKSIDDFRSVLVIRGESRALNVFDDAMRSAGTDRIFGWPKIGKLSDFAALGHQDVMDARNAGRKTWSVWAHALRTLNHEPQWAAKLMP